MKSLTIQNRVTTAIAAVAVAAVLLFFNSALYAQTAEFAWAKRAGGAYSDWGRKTAVDPSGNIITVGRRGTPPPGTRTYLFLRKYDESGNVLWTKEVFGASGQDVATDGSGNIYVTGHFRDTVTFGTFTLTSAGSSDIFLVKYNPSGSVIWAKQAGGDDEDGGHGIAIDGSGNICVTGMFVGQATFGTITLISPGAYDSDIFVAKYDGLGAVIWAERAGGTNNDDGEDIAVDGSGAIFVSGYFSGVASFGTVTLISAGDADIFVAEYDGSGDVMWAERAGGTGPGLDGVGWGISTDALGNCFVTGRFSGTANFGPTTLTSAGLDDIFIAKYDGAGNVLWAKQAGGASGDEGFDIATDGSGNSIITGSFSGTASFGATTLTSGGLDDIFIVKYDGAGNVLWAKQVGGTNVDLGEGVAIDESGNSYVTGAFSDIVSFDAITLTSAGDWDIFVARLEEVPIPPPGTFDFDDGTDQGWTVRGAYDEDGNGPFSSNFSFSWWDRVNYPNPLFTDPVGDDKGSVMLFTSSGHGINNPGADWWVMQLHSPDLSASSTWQAASGYTVEIADAMSTGGTLYSNLYVVVYDIDQSKDRYFYSGIAEPLQHYSVTDWNHLTFDWSGIPTFPTNYVTKKVFVNIWGKMTDGVDGGVYLDEVTAISGVPEGPSNLKAYQTPDRIHLTWDDNSDDETGFKVEYKLSPDESWQPLATVDADTTFHQMPYDIYQTYYFRVAAFNSYGDSDYSSMVSIYTARLLNWIKVDSPNGGEEWPILSTQQISWSSSNGLFAPSRVNLYYATDTRCSWKPIEANVENTGSYNWQVPADISSTCLVKVESAGSAMYDLSNEYFSITPLTPADGPPGELPGDLNGDCKVDLYDLATMAANWLKDITPVLAAQMARPEIGRLNLSEPQRARMRILMSQYAEKAASLHADMVQMKDALQQLLKAEPVHNSRAKELIHNIVEKEAEMRLARIKLDGEIREVLTPEQRKQVPMTGGAYFDVMATWLDLITGT